MDLNPSSCAKIYNQLQLRLKPYNILTVTFKHKPRESGSHTACGIRLLPYAILSANKKRNFCLPKVPFLFIHCESNGISSRFSVHLIRFDEHISSKRVYHQPEAVSAFAMMIYNAPHWWYTATICGWYTRLYLDLSQKVWYNEIKRR